MAEALAALGLASSIVQFVDFGTKLLSNSKQLYRSADGVLQENAELEEITRSIQSVAQNISRNATGINDQTLRDLAGRCSILAEKLLAMLQSLKIDSTKNRSLEVVGKSLKSLWHRRAVKDIYDRLSAVQTEVCLHLNSLLSDRHAVLLPAIHDFLETNEAIGFETQNKLDEIRNGIQRILSEGAWMRGDDNALSRLSASLTKLVVQTRTSRSIHLFLKSLCFKQIKARQFEVKTAHINTFEWIFKKDVKHPFVQWLKCSAGIFWVGGKAGSGKSTLMKFLGSHHKLETLLQAWAGRRRLLIACHFFWAAGTTMQKSQEGLLRSLLFQIMASCPDLIPIVCPNRWNNNAIDSFLSLEPWSLSELAKTLEALASLEDLPVRICLLIDGLDEYDGEHSEIVSVIKTLARSSHIKLCVSSRPWTIFVDAFDGSCWKLYLQDLTRNDIRLYIKETLEEDDSFRELKSREHRGSESLVHQIVDKAQGVFLWVYLVVRSLLRGLSNRDDISDLERRLAKLPSHLETYFKHMLDTIEDVYQQQTAQIFQIMVNASTTLPLIALHFMDNERKDPNYALHQKVEPISHSDFAPMVRTKRRQLNARCKDLIEVTMHPEEPFIFKYRVGFLHRTVIDFLRTKDMETLMMTRSGLDFNCNLSLCRAYLAQVKALPIAFVTKNIILRNLILGTIYYARQLEVLDGRDAGGVLDELNQTIELLDTSWEEIFPTENFSSVMEIAVRSGLQLYVELKVKTGREGTFLYYALERAFSIRKDFGFESLATNDVDISMLRLLLDLDTGQSNLIAGVWNWFLHQCLTAVQEAQLSVWDMTRNLLPDQQPLRPKPLSNAYKACEMVILHARGKGIPLKVENGILDEIFTPDQARRLNRLVEEAKTPKYEKISVRTYRQVGNSALLQNIWRYLF